MKWWNAPTIEKLYTVGVPFEGTAADGQINGWMCEGIFKTEDEAVANCLNDNHFVAPIPVGVMIGDGVPDGMYWPTVETKEKGQLRIDAYRMAGNV